MSKIVVFVFVWMCAGATGAPGDNTMGLWRKNLEATLAFACREPQRRAIKATELLAEEIDRWDVVVPHTTVLHRCERSTGCCNDAYESCAPVETEEVHVVFLVHSKSEGQRYVVHKARNHTKCGCKRTRSDIK